MLGGKKAASVTSSPREPVSGGMEIVQKSGRIWPFVLKSDIVVDQAQSSLNGNYSRMILFQPAECFERLRRLENKGCFSCSHGSGIYSFLYPMSALHILVCQLRLVPPCQCAHEKEGSETC